MTTADQLAIVNRLLHAPEEAYTIAQVNIIAFPIPHLVSVFPRLTQQGFATAITIRTRIGPPILVVPKGLCLGAKVLKFLLLCHL